MALLFCDGFDSGDTFLPGRWTDPPFSINNTTDPLHGNYAQVFGTSGTAGMEQWLVSADQDDVLIVGCHLRPNVLGADSSVNYVIGFKSDLGVTLHVTVGISTAGEIVVRKGGVDELGRSDPLLIANVWYHLEARAVLHDSAGEVQVYLDGVEVINEDTLDTKNGGTKDVFDSVRFERPATGGSAEHSFDDIFILNSAGPVNNGIIGPSRVTVLLPNADSTPEQWTRSEGDDTYALIDEVTPNGDTDYIESDVPGEKAQVGLTDLTDTTHVVHGIQMTSYARRTEAGPAKFRMGVSSDSNLENGVDHVLSESYVVYRDVIELDPDGDVAWTPTQLNAAEAFVEVRS